MGLKEFLDTENSSVYRLCKETGLPQSTINEFDKSKDIKSMKLGMAAIIAKHFNITLDDFYNRCQ